MKKIGVPAAGALVALAVAGASGASLGWRPIEGRGASAAPQRSAPAASSNLLRAGRDIQTVGNLRLRGGKRTANYADAIRAFGKPAYCRAFSRGHSGSGLAPPHSRAEQRSYGVSKAPILVHMRGIRCRAFGAGLRHCKT